ncbi:type I polyketide synthase, partial [Streptomyces sp. NPDC055078]
PGVAYRDAPLRGETAFVFTNAAATYPGMGSGLGQAFRPTAAGVAATVPGTPFDASGFGRHSTPADPLEQLVASILLSTFHTALTRDLLGIRPAASIGFCTGEVAAAHALGVWSDVPGHLRDAVGSRIFSHELSGEFRALRQVWRRTGVPGASWMSYWVNAPTDRVRAVVDPLPSVHLMSVYAPESCVVGGETDACRRVVARHFPECATPTGFDTAAHVPEAAEIGGLLRALLTRPTAAVPGVRFYSGSRTTAYLPTREGVADALTDQMIGRIDLHATVNNAWADGVRIFLEHGPGGMSTASVRAALGEREYLAVALDAPGSRAVPQFCRALAELAAAGVTLDTDRLFAALSAPPRVVPALHADPVPAAR